MSFFKKSKTTDCKNDSNSAEKKNSPPTHLKIVDTNIEKAEIDRLKNLITAKIKDPIMAKKAALIIAEMLKKSK